MNDHAVSVPPATAPPPATETSAPLWHLGWAVGALAAGAGLLACLGAISWPTISALAIGAAPGLVGYFWRPASRVRLVLLVLWAVAAAAAAAITGGATGPLAVWCVLPLLAGGLIGAPAEGAVLAAAAVAVVVLVQLSGLTPPSSTGAFAVGLAAAGLLTIGAAATGAVGILVRRARDRQSAADTEQAWMSGVMSDLPYLALALDREGALEAMFGAGLPGLEFNELRDGVVAAAVEADRPAVRAAICEALDHGTGETEFSPAGAPGDRLILALRRRGEDGLSALVRDLDTHTPALSGQTPAAAAVSAPAVVDEGPVARLEAAEARAAALVQKLKNLKTARDQALNALGAAHAAQAAAEAARDEANASATAKSRFLANMSHELRTPLNAIMGFSDIMRARMFGDLTPKYAEYAELIHESGRHLTDLINDVLDMSKIEAERYTLDLDLFDARDPVSGALRLMRLQADEAGVQLRGVLPQQAVMVDADRRALKQIVLNLVSNALKFTPAGGSITVTLQAVGDALELVVADTGVGIAREDQERRGRPDEQAGDAEHKAQGTGLGLSLVKAFARLNGGEMTIESELGEGAAMTVRLPVLHEAPAAQAVAEPAPEPVEEPVPESAAEEVVAAPAQADPADGPDLETGPSVTVGDDTAPRMEAPAPQHTAEVIPLNLLRS